MKKIGFLYLLTCSLLSAQGQEEPKQVRVYQPGTESYEMVNVIDLLGEWRNISSTSPTAIHTHVEDSFVSLSNGNRVRIKDQWVEDYPTRLRNCTWAVVDDNLILSSPELGAVEVEIVRVGTSAYLEFVLKEVTYRKLVNRSSKSPNAG